MYALAIALSVLIGVVLGLLGGGGSILTTPILLYALNVPPKQAIASSLLVVGTTSAVAVIQHARAGNVVWKVGFTFGAAGMAGAWLGGLASAWFPDRVLLVLFAGMMLGTAFAMFRGRKDTAGGAPQGLWKVLLTGIGVGAVSGLVGAGGGFLVVPALVLVAGLPMRKSVATSLLVIALQCFAGYAGHAAHVDIDLELAGVVAGSAVAGSLLGAAFAQRIHPEVLRKGFAGFVLVMAAFVVYQQV